MWVCDACESPKWCANKFIGAHLIGYKQIHHTKYYLLVEWMIPAVMRLSQLSLDTLFDWSLINNWSAFEVNASNSGGLSSPFEYWNCVGFVLLFRIRFSAPQQHCTSFHCLWNRADGRGSSQITRSPMGGGLALHKIDQLEPFSRQHIFSCQTNRFNWSPRHVTEGAGWERCHNDRIWHQRNKHRIASGD